MANGLQYKNYTEQRYSKISGQNKDFKTIYLMFYNFEDKLIFKVFSSFLIQTY